MDYEDDLLDDEKTKKVNIDDDISDDDLIDGDIDGSIGDDETFGDEELY